MREFTSPKVDTKSIGEIKPEYVFQIVAQLDKPVLTETPRGGRIYQSITGGKISGPKLSGTVEPDSGGEYGLRRTDNVDDLDAHFMLRAADGEWIYIQQSGYHRHADGYYRLMAYFDAERGGKNAWLNDTVLVVKGRFSADRRQATFTYFAAL
jgi:hypothetical protein